MWWLVSKDKKYPLLVDKNYEIGRKEGDITVPSDQSMSRKHARVVVKHVEANIGHPHKLPEVQLTDTSRLGTVLDNERFIKQTRVVKPDSQIMFGTGESTFDARYEPYLVTTSCLDTEAKRGVKTVIVQLGGHLVNDWRKDCNLLVMSNLSVTVKVICALVSQKDVVTQHYLQDMVTALQAQTKLPNPHDYIPPLAESQVNPEEVSFKQNAARKTLFQGKIFIFLTPKQFKKLSMAVELAGGTPMLMEEGSEDEEDLLTASHTCVMVADPDASQMSQNAVQWVKHVLDLLQKHGRRPIQDSELGYAVLYVSTDKYCNPSSKFGTEPYGRPPPSQSLSQAPSYLDVPSQRRVAASEIKEEQASQADATPFRGKRRRDKSEVQSIPATKSRRTDESASAIEIKPEAVTPRRPTSSRAAVKDEVVTPGSSRGRRKSPSPAPPSPGTRRSPRHVSPAPTESPATSRGIGRRASPAAESTARGRKASPIPTSPVQRTRRSSPTPETSTIPYSSPKRGRRQRQPISDKIGEFDFASIPTRKTEKGKKSDDDEINNNPALEDIVDFDDFDSVPSRKSKPKQPSAATVNDDVQEIDLMEDFDAIPKRKRGKRGVKSEPDAPMHEAEIHTATITDDGFDNVPSRKGKRKHTEPASVKKEEVAGVVDDFEDIPVRKSRKVRGGEDKVEMVLDGFDDVPSRKRGRKGEKEAEPIAKITAAKKENVTIVEDSDEELIQDTEQPGPSRSAVSTSRIGATKTTIVTVDNSTFLTTTKPLGDQVSKETKSYQENLGEVGDGQTEVEMKSLLARKSGEGGKQGKAAAECNTWKGRVVKNFKKFRKSGKAAMRLPHIIGGSDLVVHESKPRKDLDDFFKESLEAELQQSQLAQEASALFEWEPPKRKSRR